MRLLPFAYGNLLLELKLPNLIITPHIAWASAGAQQAAQYRGLNPGKDGEAGGPLN